MVFLASGSKESIDVFLSHGEWLCVSKGQGEQNGSWVVGQKYSEPRLRNGWGPKELTPAQLVAVRVDASGNIVGVVGTGGDSGSAVGWTSCWASFTGIARYN